MEQPLGCAWLPDSSGNVTVCVWAFQMLRVPITNSGAAPKDDHSLGSVPCGHFLESATIAEMFTCTLLYREDTNVPTSTHQINQIYLPGDGDDDSGFHSLSGLGCLNPAS